MCVCMYYQCYLLFLNNFKFLTLSRKIARYISVTAMFPCLRDGRTLTPPPFIVGVLGGGGLLWGYVWTIAT